MAIRKKIVLFLSVIIVLEFFSLYRPFQFNSINPISKAAEIKNKCEDSNQSEKCFTEQFYRLTKETDFHHAISTLDELNNIEPKSLGCHLIAHGIAIAQTEKNITGWQELLKKVDINQCSGGYVHGIIEARLKNDGKFKIDNNSVREICTDVVSSIKGEYGELNCAHILGHLALLQEKGNIKNTVEICSSLTDKLQFDCQTGLFMENLTRDNLITHLDFNDLIWDEKAANEIENLCSTFSGLPAMACWQEISHIYAAINPDPYEVFQKCNSAPLTKFIDSCYFHVTSFIVSKINENSFGRVCEMYSNDKGKYKDCVRHIIFGLLSSSDHFKEIAGKFCEAQDGDSDTKFCMKETNRIVKELDIKPNITKSCGEVGSDGMCEAIN